MTKDSIPFKNGKNASKPIKDLDDGSLKWIIDKSTMSDSWKDLASKILSDRALDEEQQMDAISQ